MVTVETPPRKQKVMVKEMSWDPITRIVGSLGIHTEIDFEKKGLNATFSFRNPNVTGECGCGESFAVN